MKYYTPTPEEFHIGFKYEYRTNGDDWVKHTIHTKADLAECIDDLEENDNIIRVKHLDPEDIESLRFEFSFRNEPSDMSRHNVCFTKKVDEKSEHILYWNELNNRIEIKYSRKTTVPYDEKRVFWELYFRGTIKNKSELKRVLTQIGVI